MKLSFSTLACTDWEIDRIINAAVKYGYSALEIRGIGGIMRTENIPCFGEKNRDKTMSLLKKSGIEIISLGTSCAFDTAEKYEKAISEGKAAIDIAQAMGIPFIRVFGNDIHSGQGKAETDAVIKGIGELCEYARGISQRAEAVKILLELHGAFNTASRLAPICSALHGRNFGLIWDLAHSYRAGEDYRELWRELSLYIKHIHIKDLKRGKNGDWELCTQGEGEIPVPETVRMLLDDGYTGYFSLEYEKAWHPSLPDSETEIEKYVKYMKSI